MAAPLNILSVENSASDVPIADVQGRPESTLLVETETAGGAETILLVEDEPSVRVLVRHVLERYGYKVLEAVSGVSAVRIWRKHSGQIDLVLTDMVMPDGISGRELIEKLHTERPLLPAIYSSGYSADVVGKNFELQEGINFLQKPYSPRKLAGVVRAALDRREMKCAITSLQKASPEIPCSPARLP